MNKIDLINKYTRRELSEDEIYTFSVKLCDNKIDRDGERFSIEALKQMKNLFIGKTGISDHNPTAGNQTARIYNTEIVTTDEIVPETGENYTYLKAECYMVRTDSDRDTILEIDGGIKKEVSVSVLCKSRKCSICGREKCNHRTLKYYGGKKAHTVLDDVEDAYEWSFVAVPAQREAGVVKHFETKNGEDKANSLALEIIGKDINRICAASGDTVSAEIFRKTADTMSIEDMADLRTALLKKCDVKGVSQIENYKL